MIHDEVQAKMNEASRGPTQRASNDRRQQDRGSAREDADQDQTFPRREPRDQGGGRGWGADPQPTNVGQERAYDGRNSPHQMMQVEPPRTTAPTYRCSQP